MDATAGQPGWTAPASSHVERVTTTVTASSTYAPAQPQPQADPHTPPHRAHSDSVGDRARISNDAHSTSESEVQSGPSDYALLRLAPAQTTTVVTTTTTTTTHFAPIRVPKSGPIRATRSSFSAPSTGNMANTGPLSPRAAVYDFYDRTEGPSSSSAKALSLDRRMYPLSQARWPDTLKQWDLSLGAMKATFSEDGAASDFPVGDARTSSAHARMDANYEAASLSTQQDRRYSTASIQDPTSPARRGAGLDLQGSTYRDNVDPLGGHADGDGIPRVTFETYGHRLPSPGPPRKRPRVETPPPAGSLANLHPSGPAVRRASIQQNYTGGSVALPSPNQSPPSPVPTSGGEDEQEVKDDPAAILSAAHAQRFDFGSGAALSGLLSLPDLVQTFSQLPDAMQSYLLFQLLRRSSIPVLQMINQIVEPALRRDFLSDLPPELGTIILGHLDARDLCRSSLVCKTWRRMIDGEWRVWKDKLVASGLWVGDGSDEREAREAATGKREDLFLKRWEAGVWDEQVRPDSRVSPQELRANADSPAAHFSQRRTSWTGKVEPVSLYRSGPIEPREESVSHRLASPSSSRSASPAPSTHFVHPFKLLYRSRVITRRNWAQGTPTRLVFQSNPLSASQQQQQAPQAGGNQPAPANNHVVTCLQFDSQKIVSASDDHSISV